MTCSSCEALRLQLANVTAAKEAARETLALTKRLVELYLDDYDYDYAATVAMQQPDSRLAMMVKLSNLLRRIE